MILTSENNHSRGHHQFKEGSELVAMQASDFQQSELIASVLYMRTDRWFKSCCGPLMLLCCALTQGTFSTLAQSTQLKLGNGLRWKLTCEGLVSHPGGIGDSHPSALLNGNRPGV